VTWRHSGEREYEAGLVMSDLQNFPEDYHDTSRATSPRGQNRAAARDWGGNYETYDGQVMFSGLRNLQARGSA